MGYFWASERENVIRKLYCRYRFLSYRIVFLFICTIYSAYYCTSSPRWSLSHSYRNRKTIFGTVEMWGTCLWMFRIFNPKYLWSRENRRDPNGVVMYKYVRMYTRRNSRWSGEFFFIFLSLLRIKTYQQFLFCSEFFFFFGSTMMMNICLIVSDNICPSFLSQKHKIYSTHQIQ